MLVSVQNLYHETQCETLKQRRTAHKLMQFHKMAYETNPPHCQSIQQAHYYTTRQYLNIRLVLCKIKRLYFSFCPLQLSSGMNCPMMSNKIFPNLISNIVLTKIQIRNTPPHVVTGSRSEQTLHTRLRLNWSLFNAHLYLRNIINNPHSLCGYFLRLNIEFSIF